MENLSFDETRLLRLLEELKKEVEDFQKRHPRKNDWDIPTFEEEERLTFFDDNEDIEELSTKVIKDAANSRHEHFFDKLEELIIIEEKDGRVTKTLWDDLIKTPFDYRDGSLRLIKIFRDGIKVWNRMKIEDWFIRLEDNTPKNDNSVFGKFQDDGKGNLCKQPKTVEPQNKFIDIIQGTDDVKSIRLKRLHQLIDGKRGKNVAAIFVKALQEHWLFDEPHSTDGVFEEFGVKFNGVYKFLHSYEDDKSFKRLVDNIEL